MIERVDAQRIARLNAPNPERRSTEWLNVASNNHGFFCKHDYPYRPSSDGFVLGVFGGSVAQWFCLQQGQSFAAAMAASLTGGRAVEILNFGLGGFKQPQSMFAFTYFLMLGQRFDGVLLLDGFNEAALSWVNAAGGTDCAQPSIQHMEMFGEARDLFDAKAERKLSAAELTAHIASQWEDGARTMRGICRDRGIPFFHVLQPNQYHSAKTFSKDELAFAVSQTSPYREGVRAIYPEMKDRMSRMRRDGWNAFDATAIFDGRMETLYSDNCCHYNSLGNSILEGFILAAMRENWSIR